MSSGESRPVRKGKAVVKCAWCGQEMAVGVKWEMTGEDRKVVATVRNSHPCPIYGAQRDAAGGVVFGEF